MSETANDPPSTVEGKRSPRFPRVYVLYAIALFVSAVTTFGGYGIIPGLLIPAAWACVFYSRSRPKALAIVCAAIFLSVCLIAMLLSAVPQAREAVWRSPCKSNLKHIGIALHNYQETH
jgi:hypothetical protein